MPSSAIKKSSASEPASGRSARRHTGLRGGDEPFGVGGGADITRVILSYLRNVCAMAFGPDAAAAAVPRPTIGPRFARGFG